MPLERAEDCPSGNMQSDICIHCAHPDGTLKPYNEVLEGMTGYLIHSQGLDPKAARQMADVELKKHPAWQKNPN